MKQIFAWATFDGEGSYDLRLYDCNETYLEDWVRYAGEKYRSWVIPLYRDVDQEGCGDGGGNE